VPDLPRRGGMGAGRGVAVARSRVCFFFSMWCLDSVEMGVVICCSSVSLFGGGGIGLMVSGRSGSACPLRLRACWKFGYLGRDVICEAL
jgi:hypothetical protein